MNRRKFLRTTSAAALTAVASAGAAATTTDGLDDDVVTYDDCQECWDHGGGYNECCGPYGPCTDCRMK